MRVSAPQLLGQVLLYAAFVVVIGYFATEPAYTHMDPDAAAITVSFGHAGEKIAPCRRLTPEEIAALPPNMRRPTDCPRERVSLLVELAVDGELLYRDWLPPSGLAGDGTSTAYERFVVAPGRHVVTARLRGASWDSTTSTSRSSSSWPDRIWSSTSVPIPEASDSYEPHRVERRIQPRGAGSRP
jgi:hypothetical protein